MRVTGECDTMTAPAGGASLRRSLFALPVATTCFTLLFCIMAVQNVAAILLANVHYTVARGAVAVKDLYLYLVLLVLAGGMLRRLCAFRVSLRCRLDVVMVFATLYFAAACLMSPARNLQSFRQMMIIPLFYAFGRFFVDRVTLSRARRIVFVIMVTVCLSGYVERFLLYDSTEAFWNAMGIAEYMKMKGAERWLFGAGGTPGSFYTMDLRGFGEIEYLRRMASVLLAEPTIFGQYLVLPVLYCFFSGKRWWLLFFLGALVAAFSKGGLLGVAVGITCYCLQNRRSVFVNVCLVTGSAALMAGIGYLAFFSSSFASVAIHLAGLATNLRGLLQHPFGTGVGSVGNWAVLASYVNGNEAEVDGSGESYLGALLGQIGIAGLAFYLLLLWLVWRKRVPREDPFLTGVKYAVLATLVSGIGSESAVSYVGSGYLFALLPFVVVAPRRLPPFPAVAAGISARERLE